jgi:hypothetical protein
VRCCSMYAAYVTECDLPAAVALRTLEDHLAVKEERGEIGCAPSRTAWAGVTERIAAAATFQYRVRSSAGLLSPDSSLTEPDLMFDDSFSDVDEAMVGFDSTVLHEYERLSDRAVGLN